MLFLLLDICRQNHPWSTVLYDRPLNISISWTCHPLSHHWKFWISHMHTRRCTPQSQDSHSTVQDFRIFSSLFYGKWIVNANDSPTLGLKITVTIITTMTIKNKRFSEKAAAKGFHYPVLLQMGPMKLAFIVQAALAFFSPLLKYRNGTCVLSNFAQT